MIGMRTPLGQFTHLASSEHATRAFCGIPFSAGFDKTWSLGDDEVPAPSELCTSCKKAYARRMRRRARGVA